MKEVKIITINGHHHFIKVTFDDVDEVIESMYKKGYEFKGSVDTEQFGYGETTQIKLIFDKEI